jgi:hypothetical protein
MFPGRPEKNPEPILPVSVSVSLSGRPLIMSAGTRRINSIDFNLLFFDNAYFYMVIKCRILIA